MDKDFLQYVYSRTEKALTDDMEYKVLLGKLADAGHNIAIHNNDYEDISSQMALMEQKLCYIQGFNDAINILKEI